MTALGIELGTQGCRHPLQLRPCVFDDVGAHGSHPAKVVGVRQAVAVPVPIEYEQQLEHAAGGVDGEEDVAIPAQRRHDALDELGLGSVPGGGGEDRLAGSATAPDDPGVRIAVPIRPASADATGFRGRGGGGIQSPQ